MSTIDKEISFAELQAVAKKLGESLGTCHTVADILNAGGEVAPLTMVVVNLLFTVALQQRAAKNKTPLVRQIRAPDAQHSDTVVTISNLLVMTQAEIESLLTVSDRVYLVRFQFDSTMSGDPLAFGCITVSILGTTAPPAAYTPPLFASQRTRQPDWDTTVVRPADRTLVLNVIHDIYNIYLLMPVDMFTAVEGIEDADYMSSVGKRVRGEESRHPDADDDEETSAPTSTHEITSLIGYALHVVGVPSFDHTFLAYLKKKYPSRWLGAVLMFPQNITNRRAKSRAKPNGRTIVVAQRLIVMISCETTIATVSEEIAIAGAKRLCYKIDSAGANSAGT